MPELEGWTSRQEEIGEEREEKSPYPLIIQLSIA